MSPGIWSRSYATSIGANFLVFFIVNTFVLYPLLVKQGGGSDTDVGVVMGAFSLVAVVLRPVSGLLADRFSSRLVALGGLVVLAAVLPSFAWIEASGPWAIAMRALLGVGWSFVITPLMALATQLTPSARLAETLGIYGISGLAAHALAPVVGEQLVAMQGFELMFYVDFGLALLAIALVATIPAQRASVSALPTAEPTRPFGRALRLALIGLLLLSVVHGAVRGVDLNFVAPFCQSLGLERASPFFVAFAAAALLTRFKLASLPDRFGERRVAIPTVILIGANNLLLSQVDSTALLVVAGLLGGLGQGLIFPALSALFIRLVGDRRRAFALSLYATSFELGFGVGLPVYGRIADALGYRWMYAGAGGLILVAGLAFALLVPAMPARAAEVPGEGDPGRTA